MSAGAEQRYAAADEMAAWAASNPEKVKATLAAHSEDDPATGCRLWRGAKAQKGHGRIAIRRRPYQAHRIAFLAFVGPIPKGVWVLHRCDVPCCINPEHLFLGSCADNVRDMVAKGRQSRGECRPLAKLTNKAVLEIRASTMTLSQLARTYGVASSTIHRAKRGQAWQHVGALA